MSNNLEWSSGPISDGGSITCNDTEAWNQFFPMSLEKAYAILAKDLPPVKIHFSFIGSNTHCSFRMDALNKIFYDLRVFDPISKNVNPGKLWVNRQANGIGRNVMRNELDFLFTSGFSKMQISAGLQTGAYTWARFGFLPDLKKCSYLKEQLLHTFNALSPFMRRELRRDLSSLIRLRHPTDLWQVADRQDDINSWIEMAKSPLTTHLCPAFRCIANTMMGRESLLECLPDIQERMAPHHGQPTLGKCFLMGRQWKGSFQFAKPEQVKRASDYVGGFSCIPD